jgi:mono/diheme cytochrome c family protein
MTTKWIPALAIATALLSAPAARAGDTPKKTPELVEKGKASFAKNCASCHGKGGEGDGPAAKALKPPPENLVTHPMKGGAPAVFEVLGKGVKGTGMIAFKHLSEDERWALAYFVEGLGRAAK